MIFILPRVEFEAGALAHWRFEQNSITSGWSEARAPPVPSTGSSRVQMLSSPEWCRFEDFFAQRKNP